MRTHYSALTCLALLVLPTAAHAAGLACHPGFFFPRRMAEAQSIPANLGGVQFWPATIYTFQTDEEDAGVAALTINMQKVAPDGTVSPVSFEQTGEDSPYTLTPDDGFEVGATYQIWASDCYPAAEDGFPPYTEDEDAGDLRPQPSTELFILDSAPLPESLPALRVSASSLQTIRHLEGGTDSPPPRLAQVAAMEFTEGLGPWQDALAFETWVDGVRYRPSPHLKYARHYGESWVGRGQDLLATLCDAPPDEQDDEWWTPPDDYERADFLTPGNHTVQLIATVPGTNVRVESPPADFTLDECTPWEPPGDEDTPDGEDSEATPDGEQPNGSEDEAANTDNGEQTPGGDPDSEGSEDEMLSAGSGDAEGSGEDSEPDSASAKDEDADSDDAAKGSSDKGSGSPSGASDAGTQSASGSRPIEADSSSDGCSLTPGDRPPISTHLLWIVGLALAGLSRRSRRFSS